MSVNVPQPQQVEIAGDAPIALYRLYSADGELLYVGITHSPSERFARHARDNSWWPLVAKRTVAWCSDRDQALRLEAAAVRDEAPLHNAYLQGPPRHLEPGDDDPVFLDRHEAAKRLYVSLSTVKRWGAAGLLEERRVGPKLVRITEASVEAVLGNRKDAA